MPKLKQIDPQHPSERGPLDLHALVRLPEALRITGKGRSSFLAAVAAGDIPAPVRIGQRSVAWRLAELIAWIESRPSARDTRDAA